ncbi:MAG: AraC family transcriptional regulator [Oscillospiraceae bacterium]|jgi:AraC-like DNA-binding protein/mannose-6-phosphate isomerase-like protein (cupin superfamily)|nr:AraC family transcriptional regulator [Oscillospiraceae bacterium]
MHTDLIAHLGRITEEEQAVLRSERLDRTLYTDHLGFTVENQKMLDKGKLIALRPHTRFIDFPEHNHNYIEIMYVLSGRVVHTISGQHRIALKAGELLFLSRDTRHRIDYAAEGDVAVNFIVLPQFFDKAYDMLGEDNLLRRFIAENLKGGGGRISHLYFQVADVQTVQNLVENLVIELLGKQPGRYGICAVTMGLLFLQLLRHTDRIGMAEAADVDALVMIDVLREIEENYRTASLTELAQRHGRTVYALSKLVQKATGQTYKALLQEKRLLKAMQLLTTTRLPVADISAWVGYENTSYFHTLFRARFGVSPLQVRKRG